jgi:hypothetical protein
VLTEWDAVVRMANEKSKTVPDDSRRRQTARQQ